MKQVYIVLVMSILIGNVALHPAAAEVTCPPGSVNEGEPCGQDYNGGCFSEYGELFTYAECGTQYCGLGWSDDGRADVDYYELIRNKADTITVTVYAECDVLIGMIETDPMGSGNCDDATGGWEPMVYGDAYESVTFDYAVQPGTYWLAVAVHPFQFEGYPCTEPCDYTMDIFCQNAGPCFIGALD